MQKNSTETQSAQNDRQRRTDETSSAW